jgi:hypothetical protein
MPRRHSMIILAFAPIPGLGHWLVGRAARGLLCFMAFVAGLNLLLLSRVMAPVADIPRAAGWAVAGAAVLYSLADVARIVLRRRRESAA